MGRGILTLRSGVVSIAVFLYDALLSQRVWESTIRDLRCCRACDVIQSDKTIDAGVHQGQSAQAMIHRSTNPSLKYAYAVGIREVLDVVFG